ncbi:Gamma-glutamyltranspeptidase precursor [Planctomycetes bacterium K2D]|uniref:Gamma-glutamyltranspeptidase n=2 Tax=Botrimarina mediterranea TaxID=2528022 RepID=A0A518K405_9BACT|nr:Gamma-glutamyltranspeptidase precursor [Botrimarina mediterranea]QDV77088.1 Gamma-glutamyltranspeptidase precursor [Planctomycetes bacterium K2D]
MRTALVALIVGAAAGMSSPAARADLTVVCRDYAVTSGHPDSTGVGLEVLRAGGNVVDAAVATSLALGVAEPYGSGIGGKGMLLYREAATGKVYALEAMCQAPAGLDAEAFAKLRRRDRYYGYQAVAVPGLVACLGDAHRQWGSKPWEELVLPAADLADEGVVVSAPMYSLMRPKRNLLRRDDAAAAMFLADGETPAVGSRMKYPLLAETLRTIAKGGPRAFYEGPIAEQIVATCKAGGSPMSLSDLRDYRIRHVAPLEADWEGYHLAAAPPPLTGGTTVLATLKSLEGVAALHACTERDATYIDLVSRSLLALYPEITRTVADVPDAAEDAAWLVSDAGATAVRDAAERLDPASPETPALRSAGVTADDTADASTTHLIVADREGNIVCLTQSLSYHMGAGVVAPGVGVLFNNSMSNFSTRNPDAVNHVAPGKHERSTIAPVIVTQDGKPVLTLGIPGGQRIPTTTIQLLVDHLLLGAPLRETFDRPRFHVVRAASSSQPPNVVDLEGGSPAGLDAELEALGYRTARHTADGHYFGGGSAIRWTGDGLEAVADQRRTNDAAGD